MGDYTRPANFASDLKEIKRRLAALENGVRASRTTVRNGLFVIADDDGRTTLAVGKQPDGTVSLRVFDPATGAVRLRLGEQPDGTYSLQAMNPTTALAEVTLGALVSGGYGLEQMGPAGVSVPLSAIALGAKGESYNNQLNVAGTGPTLSAMTVNIPSTQLAEVEVSAHIDAPAGATGYVGLLIDGLDSGTFLSAFSMSAHAITCSATKRLFVGEGNHTFALYFGSVVVAPDSVDFYNPAIHVRPY